MTVPGVKLELAARLQPRCFSPSHIWTAGEQSHRQRGASFQVATTPQNATVTSKDACATHCNRAHQLSFPSFCEQLRFGQQARAFRIRFPPQRALRWSCSSNC